MNSDPQNSEQRQALRYDKNLQIGFNFPYGFPYDAATKLKYQVEDKDRHRKKYTGVSKNIGVTGLCLTSDHSLEKGQQVQLEVFLPYGHQPIHMDGEVCWCERSSLSDAKRVLFDTGIKLMTVEGQSVDETVHLDEAHHVLWSNVLESIFGTFRKLVQEDKQGKLA